jgi:precorrin-2 dehydrogenase/sirohydrochlorin ferrochelatase
VPSIVDAGDIKIAISTNGKAPSVAQKIRKDLEHIIQVKYSSLVDIIHEFREKVQSKIIGENNVMRRSKLIRWYTDRVFKERLE